MEDSKIGWTDDTVNPWWGCVKISPACRGCYAEVFARRTGRHLWGPSAPRWIRVEAAIGDLEKIARRSDKEGRPRRVFIASMSDIFEDRDDLYEARRTLWDALHDLSGRVTPLILTKRPAVMAAWARRFGWPEGAWAGTTAEDQRRADERMPHLRQVPAPVRFLSCEPLLEPLALDLRGIDWVIAGGESGGRARRTELAWLRDLRDQCRRDGAVLFVKQLGARQAREIVVDGKTISRHGDRAAIRAEMWPEDLRIQQFPTPRALRGRPLFDRRSA